jgi:hypothetical protein
VALNGLGGYVEAQGGFHVCVTEGDQPQHEATAPRFQLDVLVAQYAEVLRESVWAEQAGSDLGDVAFWSRGLTQMLPGDEDVAELVGLVERAAALSSP